MVKDKYLVELVQALAALYVPYMCLFHENSPPPAMLSGGYREISAVPEPLPGFNGAVTEVTGKLAGRQRPQTLRLYLKSGTD